MQVAFYPVFRACDALDAIDSRRERPSPNCSSKITLQRDREEQKSQPGLLPNKCSRASPRMQSPDSANYCWPHHGCFCLVALQPLALFMYGTRHNTVCSSRFFGISENSTILENTNLLPSLTLSKPNFPNYCHLNFSRSSFHVVFFTIFFSLFFFRKFKDLFSAPTTTAAATRSVWGSFREEDGSSESSSDGRRHQKTATAAAGKWPGIGDVSACWPSDKCRGATDSTAYHFTGTVVFLQICNKTRRSVNVLVRI